MPRTLGASAMSSVSQVVATTICGRVRLGSRPVQVQARAEQRVERQVADPVSAAAIQNPARRHLHQAEVRSTIEGEADPRGWGWAARGREELILVLASSSELKPTSNVRVTKIVS